MKEIVPQIILAIIIGMALLFVYNVVLPDGVKAWNDTKKQISESRFKLEYHNVGMALSVATITDKSTGKEYLHYSGAMVELKPLQP
jgi:hypothetical protein